MTRKKRPALPKSGGSYIRDRSGLKKVGGTRPAPPRVRQKPTDAAKPAPEAGATVKEKNNA